MRTQRCSPMTPARVPHLRPRAQGRVAPAPARGPAARPGLLALALLMLVALAFAPARAQGPAGNGHPQTQMLSRAGSVNPFGEPPATSVDTDAKWAFARQVDLDPLRSVALYHNGRLKIIDTLARETVGAMAGRREFLDFATAPDGRVSKLRYDPLFTFFDMIIDPTYYLERPVVAVGYLPLREAFLDKVFPGASPQEQQLRERWKKMGRLSPQMIGRWSAAVSTEHGSEAFQKALGQTHEGAMLFALAAQNLLLVPSDSAEAAWGHLSTLDASSPAAGAVKRLGEAWRALDAAGVNAAVRELATVLPTLNTATYPSPTRRGLELTYNRAKPFEWGSWLYAVGLLAMLLAFGTGRRWLMHTGTAALAGAVLLHAGGFTARCVLAERFAIQNQFESMTGVSLFAAVVGLVLALTKRQPIYAAATAAVGFLVLVAATQTGIPGSSIEREAAILNTSVLLKYHVTTVLLSYGLISLGMVVSVFYLATHYLGLARAAQAAVASAGPGASGAGSADAARSSGQQAASRSRVLEQVDRAQMTILQLAFWTLGVGILLGAWWADHSWGRWWAFDPKETWALLTWLVYLVVVHLRVSGLGQRGLFTAWLSVLGFVVMLWCYFGVNLLLPGLHAYA